jgi:RNA polymerase sigma-70 factor (ECF subfamily)
MMPNLTPQDEAILIQQARRDHVAFATLYRSYLNPIYRYLHHRLGNRQEAEDLTAQVFTEALEGLIAQRYREGGKFVAWLYTIARHKLIDFYRKRPHLPLDEHISTPSNLLADIEAGDDQSRIAHLLAQLDDEKRELLRLRFTAGLSFAEIAAINGRSEAAIKMSIYRTIDWLRSHWEDENG